MHPRGLAVTDFGHIVVCDTSRIQVFTMTNKNILNDIVCLHELHPRLPEDGLYYSVTSCVSRNAFVIADFHNCGILTVALDDLDQDGQPKTHQFQFTDRQLNHLLSDDAPLQFSGKVHVRGVCMTDTDQLWICAVNDLDKWTLIHLR